MKNQFSWTQQWYPISPNQVAQNLLWVWSDHSLTAFTDCTSK
ncbi:MAG: hypothetical protein ACKPEO_09745 [Sphaerospermopsis kisseleviana]|uniref:Uncharacterized protein n=2 Tax=Sphaerospermopsis TaxID=752201 RepID=A0A479ZT43_9CYAN|nr:MULTISPECIES: hypothetical protein [Sphaerospermopsis]MDB9442635.1 hypothetical protein [Sphaerospermopsis kisseleviana CS-549]BAZ82039.1 hypothetical protein NIES73_33090 [Sphaerospermopsis kisseleviana NIES-73]GCL35667.1 hypothetical protein SR1949_07640 [Sphaerospermopsis reniformis]